MAWSFCVSSKPTAPAVAAQTAQVRVLADALDQLQRCTRNGTATPTEHTLDNRTAPTRTPPPTDHARPAHHDGRDRQDRREQQDEQEQEEPQRGEREQRGRQDRKRRAGRSTGRAATATAAVTDAATGEDPQDLSAHEDEDRKERGPDQDDQNDDGLEPQVPYTGLGLFDAEKEAELW